MRRGEKALPVYRASQLGMKRTQPFKRPVGDSLPVFNCGHDWCGRSRLQGVTNALELTDWSTIPAVSRWFCSWGCASRYSIVQELRQP